MSVDPKSLLNHCSLCGRLGTFPAGGRCGVCPPPAPPQRSLWRRATDWFRTPGPRHEPPDTRRLIPPQGGSGTAPPRGRSVMTPPRPLIDLPEQTVEGRYDPDDVLRLQVAAQMLANTPPLTQEQITDVVERFRDGVRALGVGMEEFARQFRDAMAPTSELNGLLAIVAQGPPVNSEEFLSWTPDAEAFARSLAFFGRRPDTVTANAVADWSHEGDAHRTAGLLAAVVRFAYDKGVEAAGDWLVRHQYARNLADRMKDALIAEADDDEADDTEPPDPPVCETCDGAGQVEADYRLLDRPVYLPCPACSPLRCPDCYGVGWVVTPGDTHEGGTRLPVANRCPRGCVNMTPPRTPPSPPPPPPQRPAWPGAVWR